MGKKSRKKWAKRTAKKKRSVFSRPHPIRRKMMLRHRKMKAFFHKHSPRAAIEKSVRRVVTQFYTVSDKVRDKLAESTMALDNPFSVQFYEDRCCIQ